MSDEKLLNDVSETEDSGYLETYVRFNDDLEKDYCFQVKVGKTFRELLDIFKSLPIALRPNLFYNSMPIGFQISTCPGYLTEDGAILFSYETGYPKFLKNVSLSDKISDNIWPGQLILPKWEFNYFGFYAFITFLLCWLYTDLPDAISPTPGICLTNQFSKLASKLARMAGQDRLALTLIEDIYEPVTLLIQILFFTIHIVKLIIIFMAIHLGSFNPIRLFKWRPVQADISREQLIELGWTGSRRGTPDDYKELYRDFKIKEHGGMVPAHQAGLFDKLKNLGVYLGDGEGFNTPLDSKRTTKDLLADDNTKLTLSYDYLAHLGEYFGAYINKEGVAVNDAIKQFRQFGVMNSDETVKQIVKQRKTLGDAKIAK